MLLRDALLFCEGKGDVVVTVTFNGDAEVGSLLMVAVLGCVFFSGREMIASILLFLHCLFVDVLYQACCSRGNGFLFSWVTGISGEINALLETSIVSAQNLEASRSHRATKTKLQCENVVFSYFCVVVGISALPSLFLSED